MAHVLQVAAEQGEQRPVGADQQQRQLAGLALRAQAAAVVPAADGRTIDPDYLRQLLLGQAQLLAAAEQGLEQNRIRGDAGLAERTHDGLLMFV
ncbi:hypothetical protein D3C78_1834530 [compost metagenome]